MFTVASLGRKEYIHDMTSPQIRPAGVVTSFNESAKDALTWGERPSTPLEQKKYRQSTLHEPGKIVKHFGQANDVVPDGPFGNKTTSLPGESVADYIRSYPDSDIARWKLDRAEDTYASSKREPLGQAYVRGHKIPDGLGSTRPFGVVVDAVGKDKAAQALKIVFPVEGPIIDDELDGTHQMYVSSHRAYAPGEQRRRNYDWDAAGVDPTTHRFGAVDKDNYRDGVQKALQPALDQTLPQPSKVASKIHEDFKLTAADHLARVKPLGAGGRNLPSDFVYGVKSLRHGPEPGVDELIKGNYSVDEQQPDADLGKSLREGWRNTGASAERSFGVPSVRVDLPMPKMRSVTNIINFGNEPDALQLLRPTKSVERGVNESHYIQLRPKSEIKELLTEADIELPDEQFEQVFSMASEADGEAEQCCLDTFFRARHHVLAQTLVIPPPF